MENLELNHMINMSLKYKLNNEAISVKAISVGHKKGCVEITSVLGLNMLHPLTTFGSSDIVEYFDSQLIPDILDCLLDRNGIWSFCQQHKSLMSWIDVDTKKVIEQEMKDFMTVTIGLDWNVFFDKIMQQMGESGFLSQSIYYYIVSNYFKSISYKYFKIDLKSVKYSTPQRTGLLDIKFHDDNRLLVYKDFFINFQFFNELTRETTTENLFADIDVELTKLLCAQKTT